MQGGGGGGGNCDCKASFSVSVPEIIAKVVVTQWPEYPSAVRKIMG